MLDTRMQSLFEMLEQQGQSSVFELITLSMA